jgi:hypothetical protein
MRVPWSAGGSAGGDRGKRGEVAESGAGVEGFDAGGSKPGAVGSDGPWHVSRRGPISAPGQGVASLAAIQGDRIWPAKLLKVGGAIAAEAKNFPYIIRYRVPGDT